MHEHRQAILQLEHLVRDIDLCGNVLTRVSSDSQNREEYQRQQATHRRYGRYH
jgi:hypothetical protein